MKMRAPHCAPRNRPCAILYLQRVISLFCYKNETQGILARMRTDNGTEHKTEQTNHSTGASSRYDLRVLFCVPLN